MGKEEDCAAQVGRRGVVVAVNPNPRKSVASKVINLLESVAVKLMHHDYKPSLPNFAPVNETPLNNNLVVKGDLPESLDGEFMMVGPNSKFAPLAGYCRLHGDGMVHSLRIKEGKAVTFISRFVRTSRFKQEEFHGAPVFAKNGDPKGMLGVVMVSISELRRILKVIDTSNDDGSTANAALVYHAGMLLVLGDKPYAIKVLENGDLQTIGMVVYDGLDYSFTSHPKIDPVTGEMFTFCFSIGSPYLIFRVISKDGVVRISMPIKLSPLKIVPHDFAITECYAIFIDHPLRVTPRDGGKSARRFDPTKKARFGILPRYARDDKLIKWFELPACLVFHTANAWEEGNEVVLICCRKPSVQGNLISEVSELYEMRFNMINGLAFQKRLSVSHIDCPKINKSYTGRKQRYVYGMNSNDTLPRNTKRGANVFSGIVKFDLEAEPETENIKGGKNIKGTFEMGPGIFGSDAVFVPRRKEGRRIFGFEAIFASPESGTLEEDDGYLIFFAHDNNTWMSTVMVIDAKTMSPDPVATVKLPTRVPYGSHALFMSEDQLREHADS